MKKKIYRFFIIVTLALFILPACEKYTDITPKGKNLLNRVEDLDLLMNYRYIGQPFNFMNHSILINDMYPRATNVPNIISSNIKDWNYTLITYDETVDRAEITATDRVYERLYPIITNVANIILSNADGAARERDGDDALAEQLKAEAYVIRAYVHFLLVNVYAKAYDPATAETDGGIPYVTDFNLEEVNEKKTVKEVYENILADIDAALALNTLPDQPKNAMRAGKGFAYAIKAWTLLSMRDYAGALDAANSALQYNSVLEDHRPFLPSGVGDGQGLLVTRNALNAPDNFFFACLTTDYPIGFICSLEIIQNYYGTDNIIKNFTPTYIPFLAEMFSGIPGSLLWFAEYQQNSAGITTSDLYLIKAECLIRTGSVNDGMDIINYIRERRVFPYVALEANNEAQAMEHYKKTARIEYLYTVKNFFNIKRLNTEAAYAETITRTINGVTYTLTPDSPLWIFPFPKSATDYNPTLTQNY